MTNKFNIGDVVSLMSYYEITGISKMGNKTIYSLCSDLASVEYHNINVEEKDLVKAPEPGDLENQKEVL